MSAKDDILKVLQASVGEPVSRAEITKAVGVDEWARRIRDLRAEGWDILAVRGGYVLKSSTQGAARDTKGISAKQRYRIFERDGSRCQRCGRTIDQLDRGEKLVADHRIPRAADAKGATTDENLWTLCSTCNTGKKHFFGSMDTEAVQAASKQSSGLKRLAAFIRARGTGVVLKAVELRAMAGIHEHARRIRELRAKGWKLSAKGESVVPGDYILISPPPEGPDE